MDPRILSAVVEVGQLSVRRADPRPGGPGALAEPLLVGAVPLTQQEYPWPAWEVVGRGM